MPADLTTAAGVISALVVIVGVLFRLHLQADAEDRRQRDENFLLAKDAVDGVKRLAASWEARERRFASKAKQ